MRGDSGVAGEGRVVALPKFHLWGKCTMPLTNINSDWMSNASSGLCIILGYISAYQSSFFPHPMEQLTSICTKLPVIAFF